VNTVNIARFDTGDNLWKSAGLVTTSGNIVNGYVQSSAAQAAFGKFAIAKSFPQCAE
jgi:hypothetical protein